MAFLVIASGLDHHGAAGGFTRTKVLLPSTKVQILTPCVAAKLPLPYCHTDLADSILVLHALTN
jgi:hypothetical protein